MVEGFCVSCKENREMVNAYQDVTTKGQPMLRAQCAVCGTNMAKMIKREIPKTTPMTPPQPIFQPPLVQARPQPPQQDRLTEEVQKIQELADRQKAEVFQQQANANPLLRKNNMEVVDKDEKKIIGKNYYRLIKIGLILFFIALGVFAYLIYDGYLQSSFICEPQSCSNSCPEIVIPACPVGTICPEINVNLSCGDTTCGEIIVNGSL